MVMPSVRILGSPLGDLGHREIEFVRLETKVGFSRRLRQPREQRREFGRTP